MSSTGAKDFYQELLSDLGAPPFFINLFQILVSAFAVAMASWLSCQIFHDFFETDYHDDELVVWVLAGLLASVITGFCFSHYYPKRWSLSDAVARNTDGKFDLFGAIFGFVAWGFFGLSYALRDLLKRSKFSDQELRLAANALAIIQTRPGMDLGQLAEQLKGTASINELRSVERLLKRHGYLRQELGLTLIER